MKKQNTSDYQDIIQSITHANRGMNNFAKSISGVINGTKTMKSAFADFAGGVLGEIAKIEAKNLAKSLFGGDASGASGISGLLGGVISGFRANGGAVASGQAYVVGEKGAELFVPSSNGTILNQSQLANVGGGGVNINMHISTADAASFRRNQGQIMADMQAALLRAQRNG